MAKVIRRGLDSSLLESAPVKPVDVAPPATTSIPPASSRAVERTSTQTVKVPASLLFELQEHFNQIYRDTGARISFQAFALEAIREHLARQKDQHPSNN